MYQENLNGNENGTNTEQFQYNCKLDVCKKEIPYSAYL